MHIRDSQHACLDHPGGDKALQPSQPDHSGGGDWHAATGLLIKGLFGPCALPKRKSHQRKERPQVCP